MSLLIRRLDIRECRTQVFEQFLAGDTLEECYAAVAAVADRWLDLLDTQVHTPSSSQMSA